VLRFEVEFSRNLEFNSEKDRDVTNLVSFLCEMLFSRGGCYCTAQVERRASDKITKKHFSSICKAVMTSNQLCQNRFVGIVPLITWSEC